MASRRNYKPAFTPKTTFAKFLLAEMWQCDLLGRYLHLSLPNLSARLKGLCQRYAFKEESENRNESGYGLGKYLPVTFECSTTKYDIRPKPFSLVICRLSEVTMKLAIK